MTPRFGKKTNKNGNRKKKERGSFIPGGTSNPDSRVDKVNFLSDRNSDGNSRILLPIFCLLVSIRKIYTYFSMDSFQSKFLSVLKQMTAGLLNNSDQNSGQESRWLSHDVYFPHSSVDNVNVPLNQFSCYDHYFAYNVSKGFDTSRVPFLRRSCN